MTNRQARAIETRKKIVQAARKVIAANGFDSVSIDDIVKEAGVSTGSFYTYFKRKEDVVEELNKLDFYRLAEIANAMQDKDILGKLRYYCKEFLREIEETGIEICRQWVRNNISPTNMGIREEEITKYRFDYRAVRSILDTAIAGGELRDDTPVDALALFVNAELYGLMVAWCMTGGEAAGSERTDALCDMLICPALAPYRQ